MQWKMVEDKKPVIGSHVFMLGQNSDGKQWFWWGFWNPDRKDGCPESPAVYWCAMPPLPIMPELAKKEDACEEDAKI
jgi:hypothetical protein